MRYLSVILWLLLGLLYYWIWSTNNVSCCGAGDMSRSGEVLPLDAENDSEKNLAAVYDRDSINADGENSDGLDSDDGEINNDEEAQRIADEETDRAIADAERNKEVTSVATKDDSGINKLTFYFPYGSTDSDYSAATQSDLKELLDNAKNSGKTVSVNGHTDSQSSADFNMRLGKRRADDVRSKIISMGMPSNKVVSKSFGETRPIATNETENGRQKNRRVEIIIE